MSAAFGPERWAIELTHVLNAAFGPEHFPIRVADLAREYSAQRFPDDPVVRVAGDDLPGFEGALYRAKGGRKGWGIIYNDAITSRGRINFTLAHELGHYLLHRHDHPQGFTCGDRDMTGWDSEYARLEQQANVFAANLLMPRDDFARQIPADARIDLDMIRHCADRYQVSLIAAALRWISHTSRRAILVVSRDGFILWARSSDAALRTGAFFRTSQGPIEIPATSLPQQTQLLVDGRGALDHRAGVWLREPVREMTLVAEQYDFAVSLLALSAAPPRFAEALDDPDAYDRLAATEPRRMW